MRKLINLMKENYTNIINVIIWILLLIYVKPIRNFIFGIFKCILFIYGVIIFLTIALIISSIVIFVLMMIAEKIGILPKGYIYEKIKKNKDKSVN